VTSPLENLCGPGQPLRQEPPDAKEMAGLERSGLRRLADAENQANSLESRDDTIRIISARPVTPGERTIYEED